MRLLFSRTNILEILTAGKIGIEHAASSPSVSELSVLSCVFSNLDLQKEVNILYVRVGGFLSLKE